MSTAAAMTEAMAGIPGGIAYEQAAAGLRQMFGRWHVAEGGFQQISGLMEGKQEGPIISWPSGHLDEDGKLLMTELDVEALLKSLATEDQRNGFLGPLSNFVAGETEKWLAGLLKYAMIAAMHTNPELLPRLLQELKLTLGSSRGQAPS
jgi:hypothetical protein